MPRMKPKITEVVFTSSFLLALGVIALGQQLLFNAKPTVFTTVAKTATGKLPEAEEVHGQLTYTVAAANADNTILGTINYTLTDESRQKIAQLTGKPLAQVPSIIAKSNVSAAFQNGTEPPVLHWEIRGEELEAAGLKIGFPLIVFDIKARPSELTRYTVEEMEALFTNMARQINSGRPTRGLIARLNRVIKGEN
jgi:hypothetical protein